MLKNIAIFGSTSHIAKGLIRNFLLNGAKELHLYTRSSSKTLNFLSSIGKQNSPDCIIHEGYDDFMSNSHDLIINCIGAGPPNKLKDNYSLWFTITEEYDNLIIKYLHKRKEALYINFSSGTVYGNAEMPAEKNSMSMLQVNKMPVNSYYSIAKLNSEAKHRSFNDYNIVDLRIFSYFSRFIDLESGYFMSDVIKSVINKNILKTNNINIIRDYIHPNDLFELILKCIEKNKLNIALDVSSKEPVEKIKALDFFSEKYGLEYTMRQPLDINSPNGSKNTYYSKHKAQCGINFTPRYTSLDTIAMESEQILTKD